MNKLFADIKGGALLQDAPERAHSGRYTALDADKLRGGYYTSSELARWLCAWAIRRRGRTGPGAELRRWCFSGSGELAP